MGDKQLYPNYSQQKPEGHNFISKKPRHCKKKKLTYEEENNSFFNQRTPQSEDNDSGNSYGSGGSYQAYNYYQDSPYDFGSQQ
jgi:hypothetical protein